MSYVMDADEAKYLSNYDYKKYERPSVTTDIAVFTVRDKVTDDVRRLPRRVLQILLIRRGQYPFKGCFGLPGGFLRDGETVEACAKRELVEETSVLCDEMELIGMASDPERDPRGWIISAEYLAIVDAEHINVKGGDDASEAKWFDVSFEQIEESRAYQLLLKNDDVTIKSVVEEATIQGELSRRFRLVKQDDIIAFDHAALIVKAIIKLRDWIDTTGVGFELVPEKFTLTQLQQTYESVKGEKLLAPAFRRKMAKIVKETEDFENDGRDAHRPARLFVDGRKDMKNKNTPFCIVCGAEFKGDVKPSKEHIIPEALGNKKLITYNICEACNNAFGGNVDNYLTDYLIIKMIRMEHLEKDKEIRLFRGKMTDDKGDTYNITDNGPAVIPKVEIDKERGHVYMEVPDIEKGKEIARGVLKKDFGKNDSEIEEILADSRLFRVGETQKKAVGVFKQNIDLDLSRFCLAAIKMAYEYAVEKLGEIYTTDEDAMVLRAYLKAGRDGKKQFSKEESDDILRRCHGKDGFIDIICDIFEMYSKITSVRKIKYVMWIFQDSDGQLLCGIRLLDEDVLSFTVFLSKDAKKYLKGKQGYTTFIFEDGSMYEP